MVKVATQDNQVIEVAQEKACKSTLLKNLLEDLGDSVEPIPLQVSSKTLNKVLEYFELDEHEDYFSKMDRDFLFEVIIAANFLDIEDLLDNACKKVADMLKNKSVEEIKKILEIE